MSVSEAVGRNDLGARVEAWVADDPDPATQAELRELIARGDREALAERFAGELQFGTAGLRGRLGAGPARMNLATVRRASAGLAAWLLRSVPGAAEAGVVVGHDARHGSEAFAAEAARVLSGAGLRVRALPPRSPTPLLAFAVRHLGCAGGVMVTASHNPPQDNGYKVYLGDGAQISPPADAEIAACIDAVGPLRDVPLGPAPERVDLANAYVDAVVGMVPGLTGAGGVPRDGLRIVYTPLHGVGRDLLLGAFARAGLPRPTVVAEQAAPDPDFPTVRRPNPEEPGTLDLALATAARERADVMIANDPDADRLAVAVPADGRWRVLTGDEVGALLAEYLLAGVGSPDGVVLVTTVASSTLLEQIAADAGVAFRRSLTGFKWIMRAAAEAAPRTLLLGYEEALGYAVGDLVHDKDGISAALTLTAAALRARADGTSLAGRLDALARRYGLYATRQVALELEGPDALTRMTATMDRLRTDTPELLLGRPVRSVEDLRPASDVLVLGGADGTRVVIRPSGTEPKLKIYLQVVVAVAGGEVGPARERARRDLDALADELEEVVSL